MEVFLVPVGETRYELYCEPGESDQPQRAGVAGRMIRRFREVMAAEQEGRRDRRAAQRPDASDRPDGLMARMRTGFVRGMAEWVAEQRLLWRLRHQHASVLVYPTDVDSGRALSLTRATLQRDIDHHRFWMVIDGLAVLIFGPLLFFVPGPNLISWYFAAKMTGHWLAFRGARQGVSGVEWSTRASEPLAAVRQAMTLPPADRRLRLRALGSELRLEMLATFVERTAPDTS
jgi:hypothetical protein